MTIAETMSLVMSTSSASRKDNVYHTSNILAYAITKNIQKWNAGQCCWENIAGDLSFPHCLNGIKLCSIYSHSNKQLNALSGLSVLLQCILTELPTTTRRWLTSTMIALVLTEASYGNTWATTPRVDFRLPGELSLWLSVLEHIYQSAVRTPVKQYFASHWWDECDADKYLFSNTR